MKFLIIILFALISCSQDTGSGIEIKNAWIREAPPGATVAALYLEINNNGGEDQIVSINTPVSEIAEIHNTQVSPDGTGKMIKLENVSIQSGELLKFSPGGKHIMLINLKKALIPGEVYEVTVDFKNSGQKSVNAVVKGFSNSGDENHSGHSMGH